MKWRWRLGEICGIVIYMHVTFLVLIGWVALGHFMRGHAPAEAIGDVLFLLLLFACVVAHEYGHALTARGYGIPTRDITLLPIGGLARLERMPRDPVQELRVALAGPAVNVVIIAALSVLIGMFQGAAALSSTTSAGVDLMRKVMWVNVSMVVFNLLPAFPLDGGRVLRALLARRMDYVRATRTAANVGQRMAILFGIAGLFYSPFLVFIALFVYTTAEAEARSVQGEAAFRGLRVRRVMVTRCISLDGSEPLSRAVEIFLSGSQRDFPVVTDGRVTGLLTRGDLLSALHQQGPAAPVAGAMRAHVAPVEASAPLEETLRRMQAEALTALPVTETGRLVGLLTMEGVVEFMMVRAALQGAASPPDAGDNSDAATGEPASVPEEQGWRPE